MVVCLSVAVFIWVRRARAREGGATFAPLALITGIWSGGVGLGMMLDRFGPPTMTHIVMTALVWVPPAAFAFVAELVPVPGRRAWIGLLLLASAGMVCLVWLDPRVITGSRPAPWGGRTPVLGSHAVLVSLYIVGGVLGSAALAIFAWRKAPPSRRRRQLGLVAAALITAMGGGIDLAYLRGVPFPPIPLGWAFCLGSVLIVFHAMAHWRLMDIRTAMSRLLFWTLAVVAILVPVGLAAGPLLSWNGWSQPLPRLVAVTAMIFGLYLYLDRVESLLDRLFTRGRRVKEAALDVYARRILEVAAPLDILEPLGEVLEAFGYELILVAGEVDTGDGTDVRVLPGSAPAPAAARLGTLPEEPVAVDELDPDRDADREARRWLDAAGGHLLLPLRHGESQVGLVVARRREGTRRVPGSERRELLERVAKRTSVALTNALLNEALERKSADLERAVAERTAELEAALETLKEAQTSLVQLEKQSSLGLLVAGVSHEINNALNFIYGNLPTLQGYAEVYAELGRRAREAGVEESEDIEVLLQDAGARLAEVMQPIDDAAQRARSIVDNLRRFARHDEAERKKTRLQDGLESTLTLLAAELRGRVRLETRFEEVPAIECYPSALNHVFLNVLLNAVQAIEGTGTITVELAPAQGGGAEVIVTDTGHGLSPEAQARAFEPFFTTRSRAAGLGLAVSRQVVERHGGSIALEPGRGGRGARVTLRLPARAPEPGSSPPVGAEADPQSARAL